MLLHRVSLKYLVTKTSYIFTNQSNDKTRNACMQPNGFLIMAAHRVNWRTIAIKNAKKRSVFATNIFECYFPDIKSYFSNSLKAILGIVSVKKYHKTHYLNVGYFIDYKLLTSYCTINWGLHCKTAGSNQLTTLNIYIHNVLMCVSRPTYTSSYISFM